MRKLSTMLAVFFLGALASTTLAADTVPFKISVSEAKAQPAPPLHSFAFAVHDGKWLLVGGRTNGFHRTSTLESTFPSQFANEYLYVVDTQGDACWKVALPVKYRNQLRVTNAEFYQDGLILYVIGGYGTKSDSDGDADYQTFPNLTAIRVPDVIMAITSGQFDQIESSIGTFTDDRLRVTGGGLQKLEDTFYLVFGQNYDRKYKGAVTGKYTEEIRRFKIRLTATIPEIFDYEAIRDPCANCSQSEYHRRDLNVVSAVRPDGAQGSVCTAASSPTRAEHGANPSILMRTTQVFPPLLWTPPLSKKCVSMMRLVCSCVIRQRELCTRRFSAESLIVITMTLGFYKRAT